MRELEKNYEIVVVGGGMAGLCAAIAAAREGSSVALVHNRPVLGGNASSEIRMHIVGADYHGHAPMRVRPAFWRKSFWSISIATRKTVGRSSIRFYGKRQRFRKICRCI